MRKHLALLFVLGPSACASSDLHAELDRARLERDQAKLEAEQARVAAEKAMLEAERVRFAAERQLAQASQCPEPTAEPPAPAELETTILQGRFRFAGGKSTVVTMHVAGMGIDESFQSDRKGQIAIELPVGSYQVSLEARGYRDKVITLDVPKLPEKERFRLDTKLERVKK